MSRGRKWLIGVFGTLGLLFTLLIASLEGLQLTGNLSPYRVPTRGMLPTLQPGDHVFAYSGGVRPDDLRQGDVIVFRMIATNGDTRNEGAIFIQRLAALPGQTERFHTDRIEVDGKPFTVQGPSGPILYREKDGGSDELIVPAGHVLTLGDNTANSFDGRYWGCLPMDRIIQKAVGIYWPLDRAGAIH
jgi:signal peptidase I